jgi:hypothetical protein
MRTSCGRSDDEPANQARETPWVHASSLRAVSQSSYYNRLEYGCWFRLLYTAARSIPRLLTALLHPSTLAALGTPIRSPKPQAFLSLVQGRESCHKQLWGVTPFRRGIA